MEIKDYVKYVEGWDFLDYVAEHSYMNPKLGVQITMSVENHDFLNLIHVSIALVASLKTFESNKDYLIFVHENAAKIIGSFFEGQNLDFAKAPDDPRYPNTKHYFAMIRDRKEN